MHIVFRTDASLAIGHGHVMRCLTLAEGLSNRGVVVSFICRELEGHLCDLIAERGFIVSRLAGTKSALETGEAPNHAAWLCASWQDDAKETCAAIEVLGVKPEWLVVDHYAIDARWEDALCKSVARIMVIDDLADRSHKCDLLLDQNLVANMDTRYAGKVPAGCVQLLGPNYALLQPLYAELHDRVPPRSGQVKNIFVFFSGAADNGNLTGRTVNAFLKLNRLDVKLNVVVAAAGTHTAEIRRKVAGHSNIRLHSGLPSLALLMVKADLAIGAAGTTSWERLCLGLPTVVITMASNQLDIADELNRRSLVRWIGDQDNLDECSIGQVLEEFLKQGLNEEWSFRCLDSVDGRGCSRVSSILTAIAADSLVIRHARLDDEPVLQQWPYTFPMALVTLEQRRNWFCSRLRDVESCFLYVAQTDAGVLVGQVRFEYEQGQWKCDFSLAPQFHCHGIEDAVLDAALLALRKDQPGALAFGSVNGVDRAMCVARNTNTAALRICVCSDMASWINVYIPRVMNDWLAAGHQVSWAHDAAELPAGDICFYLSYGRISDPDILAKFRNNLVVHESDLPKGRGWSPLTWQLLEGRDVIPVTLFEAAQAVDSGQIYAQENIYLDGTELVEQLRLLQVEATFRLCKAFVADYPKSLAKARSQQGEPTYYPRRRPIDGQLDLNQSLRAQFNLLRVSDDERYPAWFEVSGTIYNLLIKKAV